jgi:hypothetical protein
LVVITAYGCTHLPTVNENSTPGIRGLNKNDNKILIEEEAEDACVGSPREIRRIGISNDEDNNKNNTKILLRIQGADLRRFDKYKKKLHLKIAPL